MCIRDRHSRGHVLARGLQRDLSAQYDGERGHSAALRDHGPCLLYTSDAADERSSVDLGGRRIIKKKNTRGSDGARVVR